MSITALTGEVATATPGLLKVARMQESLAIPDSNIGRHARTMHPVRECQTPGRERIMTQLTLQSIDAIGTSYTQVVIEFKKPERTEISP